VSIRWKNGRPIVEVYDPVTKAKKHVKARDYGMEPPKTGRQAQALERAALNAREAAKGQVGDESVDSFHGRWARDFGRKRGESTNKHNVERASHFAKAFAGRSMRSITRTEGRTYGLAHPSQVPALRLMFNDAAQDGIVDDAANPFAALGIERSRGREDITVLTSKEVDLLASIALAEGGEAWGPEIAAMIEWAAYTAMRTGETFAAKRSLLAGDVYSLETQFNNRLQRETEPKHGGRGVLYVPPPAQEAVARLPRRLGVDLLWRTVTGRQFKQSTWSPTWKAIRTVFMRELAPTHHLHRRLRADPKDVFDFYELRHFGASYMLNDRKIEPWVIARQLRHKDDGGLVVKLYGHPKDEVVIDHLRRGWQQNVRPLRGIDGDQDGPDVGIVGGSA
jgi:integrase